MGSNLLIHQYMKYGISAHRLAPKASTILLLIMYVRGFNTVGICHAFLMYQYMKSCKLASGMSY